MSNQHKHADLIHAWANGAKIQYFNKKRDEWVTVKHPSWKDDVEYRLKLTLEDWQQELVDAILKDGKTVEFQLGGSWHEALLNDVAHDRNRLLAYGWSNFKDRYRIKPDEPTIKVYGVTLHGLSVGKNGETEPYTYTDDNHQFTCKAGDELVLNLSIKP